MDINSRAYCKLHHVGRMLNFNPEIQEFNLTVPLRQLSFYYRICIYFRHGQPTGYHQSERCQRRAAILYQQAATHAGQARNGLIYRGYMRTE